jgi:hypothetical protein
MIDTIVESVRFKFKRRSEVGIEKYGTTLDRDDLDMVQWLTHFQEELQDALLYSEKLLRLEIDRRIEEKRNGSNAA